MVENKFNVGRNCLFVLLAYTAILFLFYALTGSQLHWRNVLLDNEEVNNVSGYIGGNEIAHTVVSPMDVIYTVGIPVAAMGGNHEGTLNLNVWDRATSELLCSRSIDTADIWNDQVLMFDVSNYVSSVRGHELAFVFTSDAPPNTGIFIYTHDSSREGQRLTVNGSEVPGVLSMKLYGFNYYPFLQSFLLFAGITWSLLACYCVNLYFRQKKGIGSYSLKVLGAVNRYRFLLAQLVARDFKTKYKRSFLGVIWSFLNPLLMMLVQYLVFSNIFRSDIMNFPVYLLIGTVFFSFFNEACSFGIGAITDNASLITKVYIPKYIFPVSKVLSSGINLLLSLVPLLAVIAITKTPITPLYFLLLFPVALIIILSMGMAMFLSSIMVFFRDTRFIWGVISMLWMYATPIFYPESIIPQRFQLVIKLNPVYHIIRFARSVILDGVSPVPQAYLYCLIFSAAFLLFGALVFRISQKKFVLHL